ARTASSGTDCWAEVRHDPPDLLVIDADLLLNSDAELPALMGEDPDLAGVPVLVLTGRPGLLAGQRPLTSYAMLMKPVAPSAVAESVHTLWAWGREPLAVVEKYRPGLLGRREPKPLLRMRSREGPRTKRGRRAVVQSQKRRPSWGWTFTTVAMIAAIVGGT